MIAIFITFRGLLGLRVIGVASRDLMRVVHEAGHLFVVRKCLDSSWNRLMGDAWVYGSMKLESLRQRGQLQTERLILR